MRSLHTKAHTFASRTSPSKDQSLQKSVLFANPTNSRVTFVLPPDAQPRADGSIPFMFFNALGQQLSVEVNFNKGEAWLEVDLGHLPGGIYFYQLNNYSGQLIKINK